MRYSCGTGGICLIRQLRSRMEFWGKGRGTQRRARRTAPPPRPSSPRRGGGRIILWDVYRWSARCSDHRLRSCNRFGLLRGRPMHGAGSHSWARCALENICRSYRSPGTLSWSWKLQICRTYGARLGLGSRSMTSRRSNWRARSRTRAGEISRRQAWWWGHWRRLRKLHGEHWSPSRTTDSGCR
jgi:hypothetical protein